MRCLKLVVVIWQVDWLDVSQAVRVRCLDLRVLWLTDLRQIVEWLTLVAVCDLIDRIVSMHGLWW